MKMLDRPLQWEQYANSVVIDRSPAFPVPLADEHWDAISANPETGHELSWNDRHFHIALVPISDAGNQHVANLVILSATPPLYTHKRDTMSCLWQCLVPLPEYC